MCGIGLEFVILFWFIFEKPLTGNKVDDCTARTTAGERLHRVWAGWEVGQESGE